MDGLAPAAEAAFPIPPSADGAQSLADYINSQIATLPDAFSNTLASIDANGRLIIADIGHFESEQFTIDLLAGILQEKFPTFAVLKTALKTNPVHYFVD